MQKRPSRLAAVPKIVRWFALSVLVNVAIFSLLRVAFYEVFSSTANPLPSAVLRTSFLVGLQFDVRLAVILNLPVLLLGWIRPIGLFEKRAARIFWTGYLVLANLFVLLVYLVDLGHYAYLQSHLNVTAVQYLYNLDTSLLFIWETYPVVKGLSGIFLVAAGIGYATHRVFLGLARSAPTAGVPGWKSAVWGFVAVLLAAAGIYGKLSYYPLRWSDAFFHTVPFSADLALNPVLYLFETIQRKPIPYDLEKVREAYPLMARYLGVDDPDPQNLNYARFIEKEGLLAGRPNVVIVILESFAFYKAGIFGNPLDPTPNFDALARKGAFFTRYYDPSTGTARSVFTTVTGLPDVESHKTSTRNPLIVTQHTIVNNFAGYSKFYFLGGSLNWANIRGLLAHNIPGLEIFEEGSYTSPRVDVWGISDLSLFEEANRVLRRQEKPFFAIIQTSGNHRPYTIPEDSRGFQLVQTTDEEVRKHGFLSVEEFNSYRFLDHSIGFFLKVASQDAYFRNTVFVFYGDHGVVATASHMPKIEEQLLLTRNHVPLVIYAPGAMTEGKVYDKIASEVDVLPTIAGITSTPYLDSTLGRDLFDPAFDSDRYAFTMNDQSKTPEIGLVSRDFFFSMHVDGTDKRLHAYASENPRESVIAEHPEEARRMETLCRGIYETARYMPYFNSPEKLSRRGPARPGTARKLPSAPPADPRPSP